MLGGGGSPTPLQLTTRLVVYASYSEGKYSVGTNDGLPICSNIKWGFETSVSSL